MQDLHAEILGAVRTNASPAHLASLINSYSATNSVLSFDQQSFPATPTFVSLLRPNLTIRFQHCTFSDGVKFQDCNVSAIHFYECTFNGTDGAIDCDLKHIYMHKCKSTSNGLAISLGPGPSSIDLTLEGKMSSIGVTGGFLTECSIRFSTAGINRTVKFSGTQFNESCSLARITGVGSGHLILTQCPILVPLLYSQAEHAIEFSQCTFSKTVSFGSGIFQRAVTLHKCKFENLLQMNRPTFREGLSLKECDFPETEVEGNVSITAAIEGDFDLSGVTAKRRVIVRHATVSGLVKLSGATFDHLILEELSGAGEIVGSKFTKEVKAEDGSASKIDQVTNTRLLEMADAILPLIFEHAEIERLIATRGRLQFFHARKCRLERISCRGTIFHKTVEFSDCDISHLRADGAVFHDLTIFKGTTFHSSPHFTEAKLHSHTIFRTCTFNDRESLGAEADYRYLKQAMAKQDNNSAEMLFGALELSSARRNAWRDGRWIEWGLSFLYRAANNYGQSLILAPVGYLVVAWAICTVGFSIKKVGEPNPISIFKDVGGVTTANTWLEQATSEWCAPPVFNRQLICVRALSYSTLNTFLPLRLLAPQNALVPRYWWLQALAGLQAVFASVVLYMLVVGIKRRFKTLS